MFQPQNGPVSVDRLLDPTDFTFQDEDVQGLRDGQLMLLPTGQAVLPRDLAWPKLTWSSEDELKSFADWISDRWVCTFNNQPIDTPQTFEFETLSNFLDIDTIEGEHQLMQQVDSGVGLQTFWPDNVNNQTGWVVQFRMQVIEDDTGLPADHGHFLLIDDGVRREQIFFHETGLHFVHNPSLNVQYDLRSAPREIRIGARQDDLYLLLDDGRGFAALNGFGTSGASTELAFGTTGVLGHYRTLWDYVHVYTDGLVVDQADTVARQYATVPMLTTTPAFSPKRPVQRFVAAYFSVVGDLANGTTNILVQYKSSVTGVWTDFNDFDVDELGQFEILLDNVPTAEDGSDELRFVISQVSTDGLGEPVRIDDIKILTDFTDGGLKCVSHWGHRNGGNTVRMELTEASKTAFVVTPTADYEVGEYEETDPVVLEPFDSSFWGWVGAGVTPFNDTTGPHLILTETQVADADGEIYPAQGAFAEAEGMGFTLDLTGNYRMRLEVTFGGIAIEYDGKQHRFYQDDYWTAREVALTGLSGDVTFRPLMAGATWRVGDIRAYDRTPGTTGLAGTYAETGLGLSVDLFLKTQEFLHDNAVISTRSGNNGWKIGLAPGGFPYVEIADGSTADSVTGLTPVLMDRFTNVALNYAHYDDHDRLQVLVDGAISGEKVTDLATITAGTAPVLAGAVQTVGNVRIRQQQFDAQTFSLDNGFTAPYFEVENAPPREEDNVVVLRCYETGGAYADDSGNGHHAHAATLGRYFSRRDRLLYGEPIHMLWNSAQLRLLHTPQLGVQLPYTIYVDGAFEPNTDFDGRLYAKWNVAGTVGVELTVLSNGTVRVQVEDGTNSTAVVSSYVFADSVRRALQVTIEDDGVEIRIDGQSETFPTTVTSLAAATEDATFGLGLRGYLRSLIVRHALLSQEDFDSWRNRTESKWTVEDTVAVDGDLVSEDSIVHGHPWFKFVSMPPHDPGYVAIQVGSYGLTHFADRPYKYTYGYYRTIPERVTRAVAGTKSPFRLVTEVPDEGVNVSLVQQPDISTDRNVSAIDLAYKQAENMSSYFGGEFLLQSPVTGEGYFDYTGQVDTDDAVLSNRSAAYRDLKEPVPLYHRYLIGRGRFYVYQPNALTEDDALVIRNGIHLLTAEGTPLRFESFPWDIEVSLADEFGNALPANVFAVTLFTNRPYIFDQSVLAQYFAADSQNNWRKIPSFIEIVNTQPLYSLADTPDSQTEAAFTFDEDGVFDVRVGRTGL